MEGRITFAPISISKARSTASFRKVPPCTTMLRPSSSGELARMTLYSAFFTTLTDRPAEMSSMVAPSFWLCLTEEFMNTVQRVPRSTGAFERRPHSANSATLLPIDRAKVSMKEPQPEEQASLSMMESMAPPRILKHLMS